MTREFEILNDSARLVLDPSESFNGEFQVRNFLNGLQIGRVKLADWEQVAMRLPYGDHLDPRSSSTPSTAQALAMLPESERGELKIRIGSLVEGLRQSDTAIVRDFPEQFS